MKTVSIEDFVKKRVTNSPGHLIYVVRDEALVLYVGQTERNVVVRFAEHLNHLSRLGQLIKMNYPACLNWSVDLYTLADCRPYVAQQALWVVQDGLPYDVDMAEIGMIQKMQPVVNFDHNPHPTPLPDAYRGHDVLQKRPPSFFIEENELEDASQEWITPEEPLPLVFADAEEETEDEEWLDRLAEQGWVCGRNRDNGRTEWWHRDGAVLSEAEMARYQKMGKLPPSSGNTL